MVKVKWQIHEVKGECTYCFVSLCEGLEVTEQLVKELKEAGMYYSKSMDVNTKLCQENLL